MTADPEAGKKMRAAIVAQTEKQIGKSLGTESGIDALLKCFVTDEVTYEHFQTIIVDILFRYLFLKAKLTYSEYGNSAFNEAYEDFLTHNTRLTGDSIRQFRINAKQAVTTSLEADPKSERRKRAKAKQSSLACYLCGRLIKDADEEVLDHVWPHSSGGGKGKHNLKRAHARCEKLKADLAVYADVEIGRFAFENLPNAFGEYERNWWPHQVENAEDFVTLTDDIRATKLRIAVLKKQEFKCCLCYRSFGEAGKYNVIKREPQEPWWFANTQAICEECQQGERNAKL